MLGTLTIKSRPLRLALLVDLQDKTSLERAIVINSTLWGGFYNPLIPVFKKTPKAWTKPPLKAPKPKEIFEGYLKAFDPDVVVNCLRTALPDYVKNCGRTIQQSPEIWQCITDKSGFQPEWGIGVFDLLNSIYKEHFRYVEKFPHAVKLISIPKTLSLFWEALFGNVPSSIEKIIDENYREAVDIARSPATIETFQEVVKNPQIFYANRMTRYGLNPIPRSAIWDQNNVFFFDANKTLDIVDYWNLRASGKIVIPVPKQLVNDAHLQAIVLDFLKESNHPMRQNPAIEMMATFVCGRSVKMEEMEAYYKKVCSSPTSPKALLQHWYPRIWDDWGRDKDHVEPFALYFEKKELDLTEEEQRLRFKAVVPEFTDLRLSSTPHLANDVDVRVYGSDNYIAAALPQTAGENLMRVVTEFGAMKDDWRIGKDGNVKLIKYESSVSLKLPLAQDVFFAWLLDSGWTPEPSPPGLIAEQMRTQLNSWIGWFNENALQFLEEMTKGKHATRGADIGEIKNKLQGTGEFASLIPGERLFTQLLERDVFVVGYENQCPKCFRHSWYSLKELDSRLNCPQCLHTYKADHHITKGKWRYKTAGPFSIEGYADGAYCVLASIELFSRKLHHLSLTPAFSFKAKNKAGENLEADFGILWREQNIKGVSDGVIFGECKSFGEFKAHDFKRMRQIAEEFTGAILVFSTFRKKLTKYEKKEISKIARRGRKYWKPERPINPVCILTGHELFNHFGPPYCWKDLGLEERFRHIVGLMEFCNATQQIHLGLTHWEEDWHKEWEKRRLKAVQKLKPAS